jgi:hypothetical protein
MKTTHDNPVHFRTSVAQHVLERKATENVASVGMNLHRAHSRLYVLTA